MFFDELSNDEWALLAALVSDEPAVRLNRRGRPRADPRVVANAVLWILTTGEPWSKLPGRYPSGPTCRRRFEEWQLNGTLLEMVRLLSKTGRKFAYVPQPVPPVAAKPATPAAQAPSARDESPRGVSWKSPESWQAPGTGGNASSALHPAQASQLRAWRSADPIADITRQLAGFDHGASAAAQATQATQDAPAERSAHAAHLIHAAHAPVPRAPALPTPSVAYAPRPPLRADLRAMNEAGAVGAAMQGLDSAIASARGISGHALQRRPLSSSLAPRGRQVAERHGYLIYVAAERVPNAMYRAWAEIMKDGKRVERSGLVGPRFADADSAEHYAFEWAAQWIDRECATQAAARAVQATQAAEAALPLRTPQSPAMSMHVPLHRSAPAAPGAMSASAASTAHAAYAAPQAGYMSGMRHVAEQVAVHHGAPLHGSLNAFRGPLRRYTGEPPVGALTGTLTGALTGAVNLNAASSPAAAATIVNAANAANAAAALAATERDKAERYPSHTELISHAG
ncbi:transposase [Paraburkholderia phenoliruptrix]|uniref:transposase n=1 Tax=Paraburkholderia phenoliruptrix TaxID=252970 RepID=UPI001C4F1361|nr:transposase [Paraburkholderia phenoliruptrix]MBW0449499.1 transposase [Paraburkholderia phenoliruptrix]MBW9099153.1 transposase [Paraburkholderia phenoliruptrix]